MLITCYPYIDWVIVHLCLLASEHEAKSWLVNSLLYHCIIIIFIIITLEKTAFCYGDSEHRFLVEDDIYFLL